MQLKDQLLENTDALITKIDEFSDSEFNTRPETDSWSAGEVLEHLYRSEYGIPRLFSGETKVLTDRAPDSYVPKMKDRFLDSDEKMEASGVILPTKEDKSKAKLIPKFRDNRHKIGELIAESDPKELCLKFAHPVFGLLTRMEWVHFSIIHTKRHMRQLDRILVHI